MIADYTYPKSLGTTTGFQEDDTTDSTAIIQFDSYYEASGDCCCKEEPNTEDQEWKKYIKELWIDALNFVSPPYIAEYKMSRIFYRRTPISISGWLAKKGYAKKN